MPTPESMGCSVQTRPGTWQSWYGRRSSSAGLSHPTLSARSLPGVNFWSANANAPKPSRAVAPAWQLPYRGNCSRIHLLLTNLRVSLAYMLPYAGSKGGNMNQYEVAVLYHPGLEIDLEKGSSKVE